MAIDISKIQNLILHDGIPCDMDELWRYCPNRMLWEALRYEYTEDIALQDVPLYVKKTEEVYVLPEPFPAIYEKEEIAFSRVSSCSFIENFWEYAETEPLYLLSNDYSWMIVLTTENTPSGEQLCVLAEAAK